MKIEDLVKYLDMKKEVDLIADGLRCILSEPGDDMLDLFGGYSVKKISTNNGRIVINLEK